MRPLAFLIVIAAAAAALWLLWPAGSGPAPSGEVGDVPEAPSRAPAAAPGLPKAAPRREHAPATTSNSGRAPASTAVAYGSVRVRLLPADGAAVSKSARLEIEAVGPAPSGHPLAVLQEDGTYVFDGVPAGRYRIRVMSEGSQEAVAEASVEKDQEATAEIPLKPGGAASYAVSLYSGEAPATVTLALLDSRGAAVGAAFQTPVTTLHLAPQQEIALPPTGKVIGLKPGRYTLKATSPEGETDEKTFDAKAGEVVALELRIRK